ncbi:hypothetical protein J3R83DRAFT_12869 [Lanmaoa asiatica]|nr:hypothetical protein J3R83DRAFT_12869 [Lanmaoa asiatica]
MGKQAQQYSALSQPTLAMSELVCKTLDHDATDMLLDKWLEHRNDAYWEWFQVVRERKHASNALIRQVIVWNKGDFVPEHIFCRTIDTGRLIPLDRTWTTHVYHHRSMQDRKLSMMPVVFTMLPELMLLRDLKRQEMDDVTEYFKLVCRYAYGGRTCKPSIASQIQYDRSSSTPVHALKPHSFFAPLRHAAVSHATQAATYTVLSSD